MRWTLDLLKVVAWTTTGRNMLQQTYLVPLLLARALALMRSFLSWFQYGGSTAYVPRSNGRKRKRHVAAIGPEAPDWF